MSNPTLDPAKYPSLCTWLKAKPGRTVEEGPGRYRNYIAIQLVDNGKPMYGFQYEDREMILHELERCMLARLKRETGGNAPGGGRVVS